MTERIAISLGRWIDLEAGKRRCELGISKAEFFNGPLLAIAIAELTRKGENDGLLQRN